ncbi:hypothetical protein LT330_007689 [Penicillium expansum]|nr:hypothetical protein LT330_007689 [Penicillium expansum]
MRYIWGWASRIYLLILVSTVLAKDDPDYNPSSNFRPNNVTGLNQLYAWVGSYYNGTTEIELNPTIGYTPNLTVCPTHKNRTTILKWNSLLAITQRGTYNSGIDPVNLWLIMFPPNQNISAMPYESQLLNEGTPLMFPVMSSLLTWKQKKQENATVPDYFNVTAARNPNSSFTLSGGMYNSLHPFDGDASWPFTLDMPACNTSQQYGNWSTQVLQSRWWNTKDWSEFVLPNVTVDFDTRTANLTLDGDFLASPYIRLNNSGYPATGTISTEDALQGAIQIRFRGVVDAYNSDILNVNSTAPAWLRTVGFGNNSLNIANSSNRGSGLRSTLWSALVVPFIVVVIVYV